MRSPRQATSEWLDRPQVTNREALTVGLVGAALFAALTYGARGLLAAAGIVDFRASMPVWLAGIIAGAMLAFGLFLGARRGKKAEELRSKISGLEARTQLLAGYEVYAEHLRDALADLRKLLAGDLPVFAIRDFIENGLFEPAQRLLGSKDRGELRFSILDPSSR